MLVLHVKTQFMQEKVLTYDCVSTETIFMKFKSLGSTDIPRIQCSNHKLNLAVRHAMAKHGVICTLLKSLNQFIDTVKTNPRLNDICREKKCVLRLENATRWSSGFLRLKKVSLAYKRGAISELKDFVCPMDEASVDFYLQILKPVYLFDVGLQFIHTSIADVS